MKKWIVILTLCTFTLHANSVPSKAPDTEPPPVTTSPVYAAPSPVVKKHEEPKKGNWLPKAVVIVTAATATLGLFLSGRDTGKRYHSPKTNKAHQ